MSLEVTTPLEREILTHYFVSSGPFLGSESKWRSVHHEIINKYTHAGLLFWQHAPEAELKGNEEALRPYMEALAAVQLPVQRWVIP